jgi:hypothetical protein
MPRRTNAITAEFTACRWLNMREALEHFGTFSGVTQSAEHIKPLHWYVACRLVVEGGFHPDEVMPHPPFRVDSRRGKHYLVYDESKATGGERTVLGGLKTKNVDVVVTKEGIGPVLAVSCKGMTRAFRNLTNRMEDTIGECTNLHITYPAMVFGYIFVIRANREVLAVADHLPPEYAEPTRQLKANDIAVQQGGEPVESIIRFHAALKELTGRKGIRNDVSRYEAITLAMIETTGDNAGDLLAHFPPLGSPLRIEGFFQTLYLRYEERYLLGAPDLKSVTRRLEWASDSPGLQIDGLPPADAYPELDYETRIQSE